MCIFSGTIGRVCIRLQFYVISFLTLLVLVTGCVSHSSWQKYELYFGRSINCADAPKIVSDLQWRHFVKTVIASRFPDGFTILDAQGAWRGKDEKLIKEPSKILVIVTNSPDSDKKIEEIRNLYKKRFKQEAVLKIVTPATVEF